MVARLTQERRPGLPILTITGYADQETFETNPAGVPVLRKPFKRAAGASLFARVSACYSRRS